MSTHHRKWRRDIAIGLLLDAGVNNPQVLVDLAQATSIAERDGHMKTVDPVTGRSFTAIELMDRLEAEGKNRMGIEFSRRRGYTDNEIQQFQSLMRSIRSAVDAGADENDVCYALGVADGQLDPPSTQSSRDTVTPRRHD